MQGFEIREYSGSSLNRVYLIWQWMKQYIFAFQYTKVRLENGWISKQMI